MQFTEPIRVFILVCQHDHFSKYDNLCVVRYIYHASYIQKSYLAECECEI